MSSKNKQKFQKAVAAASPRSSPAPSASSGPTTSFSSTPLQQNTLQALHQEQLARLASITLPKLASAHSQRFLTFARAQVSAADAMWSNPTLNAVKYRRTLWAEDIEPVGAEGKDLETAKKRKKEGQTRIVPDFYQRHNPRCSRCALPLVAGLNSLSADRKAKSSTSQKSKPGKERKRLPACTLCNYKTRSA